MAENLSHEEVSAIEKDCCGLSTSAFRFFLLTKTILLDSITFFKVYSRADVSSRPDAYRYDVILVSTDGLLATTSEYFQSYGIPDESLLALWLLGYIQLNTVMHISSYWFQKKKQRLPDEAVVDGTVANYNILSTTAVADSSRNIINKTNLHKFSRCTELSREAWSKVLGTMASNTKVSKVFSVDLYKPSFVCVSSLSCYSRDWHKSNCVKAINLFTKDNRDFQMALAQLVQNEYDRQIGTQVSRETLAVTLSSESSDVRKLKTTLDVGQKISRKKKRYEKGTTILLLHTFIYSYILLHTLSYSYILLHTFTYYYIPLYTLTYSSLLLHTTMTYLLGALSNSKKTKASTSESTSLWNSIATLGQKILDVVSPSKN